MAVGALATRVTVGPQMAGFAVGIGPMVEMDLIPIGDFMAVRALAGPVPPRRDVAPRTVGQVGVAKVDLHPIVGAVTSGTLVEIVTRGGCIMARLAVG